ncbi:MAG: hypothetical protein HN826_05370 [Methylococcales bacterium]|mgnify:CR=1 FL=1|nr:hypothetical protein [Methylococcales bacterium]
MLKIMVAILSSVMLCSCVNSKKEVTGYNGDRLQVQVCFPKKDRYNKPPMTITFVEKSTLDSAEIKSTRLTQNNKPVYETIGENFSKIKSVVVQDDRNLYYAFNLPENLIGNPWGEWQKAKAVSKTSYIQFMLMKGEELSNLIPIDEMSPRVRFRLNSLVDYQAYVEKSKWSRRLVKIPDC